MSRVSLADLCDEGNSLISELQHYINAARNNIDCPFRVEREIYIMGYVVKKLDRLQQSLMSKIESSTNDA